MPTKRFHSVPRSPQARIDSHWLTLARARIESLEQRNAELEGQLAIIKLRCIEAHDGDRACAKCICNPARTI